MTNRICQNCTKPFRALNTEIKRGGAKFCSRACWKNSKGANIKRDKDSPNWKGDSVGVSAVHDWVRRQLGRPNLCQHCGLTTAKKYEWANISGKYLRDLEDWIRLCTKCHMKMDNHPKVRKETLLARYGKIATANNDKITGKFVTSQGD